MYIYGDNAVCCLTLFENSYDAYLNALFFLKYPIGKADLKCTYHVDLHVIYRTNHACQPCYRLHVILV